LAVVEAAFAAGFFVAIFVAAGFLAAVVAVFFAAGFSVAFGAALAGVFWAASSLTPASLATRLSWLLRRAAVRLSRMFFLTAVSISLCAADSVLADGLAWKALTADLTSFLVATLRSRRTTACSRELFSRLVLENCSGYVSQSVAPFLVVS
jgi:hypothetical protein